MAEETSKTSWSVVDGSPVATFVMNVAGGDLPDKYSVKIGVKIMFKDATFEDYKDFITGGMSGRVTLQRTLRMQSVNVLNRMRSSGLTISVKSLSDPNAFLTPQDRAAVVARYLQSLPKEVQEQAFKDFAAMENPETN